jgi:hypothetical protein
MRICKFDEIINPITNRCIKINGSIFLKLDLTKLSINDQEKIKLFNKEGKNEQIIKKKIIKKKNHSHNEYTFLELIPINDIPINDLIKLSNNYSFSAKELDQFIYSDTFKNLNPHNQEIILFNMDKDEIILNKFPVLHKKILFALKKLELIDGIEKIYERLDYLYKLCKLAGIVTFDNLGSFSKKSEVFNLSLQELTNFNDSFGNDIESKEIIYALKHPKTNESVRTIINNCNEGSLCIHKAGSLLLQIFIHVFIKLENIYNIKYDISKGKVIFTKLINNRLYFKQINSKEIHENGTIYMTNLLITSIDFQKSSMYTDNTEHLKYKCSHLNSTCFNKEDIYLYTNNYDVESWTDMNDIEIIKLHGNYCFGLEYILEYINNKLNSSNMNNPFPSYPLNPFTNEILTQKDMKKIKKLVLLSQTKVALPLKIFLEDESLWIDDIKNFDKYKVIDKLETYKIRFKRINLKDSQDNFTGYWVLKNIIFSSFEKTLYKYMNTLQPRYKTKLQTYNNEFITYSQLHKYYLYSEF